MTANTGEVALAAPAKPNPVKELMRHFVASYDLLNSDGRAYAVPRQLGPVVSREHGVPGVAQSFGAELRRKIVRLSALSGSGQPISKATADTVMMHLDAKAHEGPETPLALRFHHDLTAHRVCIDLGRPDGHVVEIRSDGWQVTPPPHGVVFRRSHATKPLPIPVVSGQLVDLAALLDLEPASEEFRALLGWVIGLPFCSSVRPGALLVGPYGSGKSTRLRLATSLLEPSATSALGSAFGRNFGDDQVRALHRAVPLWDNLTAVSGAISDELCTLVTGTARETRSLYSDNDMNTVPIARPVGLTAVGVPAGLRPDALDRLITLELTAPAHRVGDAELQRRFDSAHPRLLGALCSAVSVALRMQDRGVPPPGEFRMAAHAHVLACVDAGVATGELVGCPTGLLAAYAAVSQRVKQRTAAEDTFGGALLALLEAHGGQWQGKASELLMAAGPHVPYNDRVTSGWPSSARRVPELLNQLREGLAALGVAWSTTTVRGKTRYTFALLAEVSS